MNQRSVLSIFLFACFLVTAAAQASTLKGNVSDNYGMKMPGVMVTVTNQKSSEKHTAMTDEGGAFRVSNLPAGQYSVQTTIPGFKTTTLSDVGISDGKDAKVKLVIAIGAD